MSLFPMNLSFDIGTVSEKVFDFRDARVCLTPMGLTSEVFQLLKIIYRM